VNTLVSQRKLKPKLGPPDVYPQVCFQPIVLSFFLFFGSSASLSPYIGVSINCSGVIDVAWKIFQGFGSGSALI
jgi:hypothetical protein